MNSKKTIKKILIILVVAVVILAGYAFFTTQAGSNNSSLSSLINSGNTGQIKETNVALANTEILKILGSIKNIELQDDIFSNPVFKQLQDTQFTIPKPTQIGRTNPFLPIGYDTFSQTSSQVAEETIDPNNIFNSLVNNNATQNQQQISESDISQNTNGLINELSQ